MHISLFESVINCRCAVFNDTYSDVVEDSDPLASRPKRIKELSKKNPVKNSKPEIISNITQKINGKKKESRQNKMGVDSYLDAALSSLQKIEAHIKKVIGTGTDEEKGRVFAKKYGKKIKRVYEFANRAWSNTQKMDLPKRKMVIVIKHGELPEKVMGDVFAPSMGFTDPIGETITQNINDILSF